MEVTGWITLAAVIVALGIGVYSFIQTNRLKRAEKRERLLNEIIKWSIDVANCRFENKSITNVFYHKDVKEIQSKFWQYLCDIQNGLKMQQTVGIYIRNISPNFGQHITRPVVTLLKVILDYIDVLEKALRLIEEISTGQTKLSDEESKRLNEYIEKMGNSSKLLDKSAIQVIEEAVKIKTRDIG